MLHCSSFRVPVLVAALSLGVVTPAVAEIKIGVLLPTSGKASQYGITPSSRSSRSRARR